MLALGKTNLAPLDLIVQTGLAITGPLSGLVLNEVVHAVSGSVRVNGSVPSRDATYCSGAPSAEVVSVVFADAARGHYADVRIPCSSSTFTFSTQLPTGTWEVRVSRASNSNPASVNVSPVPVVVQTALAISGPVSNLVLNEILHPVSGSLQVNGQAPTRDATYCSANPNHPIASVRFINVDTKLGAYLTIPCSRADFAYSLLLPAGTYDVSVTASAFARNASVNLIDGLHKVVAGLAITGPLGGLVLNQASRQASGKILINGQAPSRDTTYCTSNPAVDVARVTFSETTTKESFAVLIPCSSSAFEFLTLLPKGTYDVRIMRGSGAKNAWVNLAPTNYLALQGLQVR